MNVWGFFYNSCIYESAPGLCGLYETKRGAEIAMEFHKEGRRKEHNEFLKRTKSTKHDFPFGEDEDWFVEEIEINP